MSNSELEIQIEQRGICNTYTAKFTPTPGEVKSGFATSTNGLLPINGLRHPVTGDTSGWFIWCGEEFSLATDFFAPLCTSHLYEEYPEIAKLLGLPHGYRFLLAGEYLDVWYDASLLEI